METTGVPGSTVTENAFTSSAANPAAALDKNTLVMIQSSIGKNISALSNFPTEVLFPPGTPFKVLDNGIDLNTGMRNIGLNQTRVIRHGW